MWLSALFSIFSSVGGSALPYLKTYWKQIGIAIIVISLGGYIYYLHDKVTKQAAVIVQDTSDLKAAAAANLELLHQISVINGTIDIMSQKSVSDLAQVKQLQATIDANNKVISNKISVILKGVKPSTCDGAIDYLIQAGQEYKK